MKFRLFFENPQLHLIRIEMDLPASGNQPRTVLQSKWRPGRYEMASYAENVCDLCAKTRSGTVLPITQSARNAWQIGPSGNEEVILEYKYFANEINAGSSFFDESQVYINGVNLLMYYPGTIDEPSSFELNVPAHYTIACGLKRQGQTFFADNYHQLVDAPLIASDTLQHHSFAVSGVQHNIWFQGEVRPDFEKIAGDFRKFGEAQTALFGSFPTGEYHYLFQILNQNYYHGVEHFNSTVIALGPGYKLMNPELYEELLGICCHELFHTWNVKALRPADMVPYRYNEENYCRLHHVTEGITTYYGDLMLLKGGVWNLDDYIRVFNQSLLTKYYANDGHRYISLEEASFNSWVNGYKNTVPNRKISFYTKGALVAFMLDYRIRKATAHRSSLDSVMREMYQTYGTSGIGYTREDYLRTLEKQAGESFEAFYSDYISGTRPLEEALREAFDYFGIDFFPVILQAPSRALFGFRAEVEVGSTVISQVHEHSPAYRSGLRPGDEIIAVNGIKCPDGQLEQLLTHFNGDPQVGLHIFRNNRLHSVILHRDETYQNPQFRIQVNLTPTSAQLENLQKWKVVEEAPVATQ